MTKLPTTFPVATDPAGTRLTPLDRQATPEEQAQIAAIREGRSFPDARFTWNPIVERWEWSYSPGIMIVVQADYYEFDNSKTLPSLSGFSVSYPSLARHLIVSGKHHREAVVYVDRVLKLGLPETLAEVLALPSLPCFDFEFPVLYRTGR